MRELVDQIFQITWDFALSQHQEVDPVALRLGIQRHVGRALQSVSPAILNQIGPRKLAVMINTASTYHLELGDVLVEAAVQGADRPAVLCQELVRRQTAVTRPTRPHLKVVKPAR